MNYVARRSPETLRGPLSDAPSPAPASATASATLPTPRAAMTLADCVGVSMAATQGLYKVMQEQDEQIASLEADNAALRSEMDDLEARLKALEAAVADGSVPSQASQSSPLPWAGLLLGAVGLVWASRRRPVPSPSEGGGL